MVRISFWSSPLSPIAFARRVDAAGQGRFRHDPAVPDRRDQVVFADDAVAVLHQVNQQVEYLRLDSNGLRTPAQLTPVGIKCMISQEKLHVAVPEPGSDAALKE